MDRFEREGSAMHADRKLGIQPADSAMGHFERDHHAPCELGLSIDYSAMEKPPPHASGAPHHVGTAACAPQACTGAVSLFLRRIADLFFPKASWKRGCMFTLVSRGRI